MTHKFLIDECLSPELVNLAVEAGHPESTCVRNRGWNGLQDHELMQRVVENDFVLVTRNSRDFRGSDGGAVGGLHAQEEIHAGLVCINSEGDLRVDDQLELFQIILDELANKENLVNQALEVFDDGAGNVEIISYEIPEEAT